MTLTVEMPEITECTAETCVYNKDSMCHARGITVGGMDDHECDTMLIASPHTQREARAGVGACRAMGCKHNRDFECQAPGISVDFSGGNAECDTFESR